MPPPARDLSDLTADDLALLAALARGISGAELSAELGVNPRTIQRRIQRLRAFFDVSTTVETVVAAVRRELI